MEGFQINYTDIYDLFWEYKTNLENLMNKIDTCENCINFFIKNAVFTGETGDAVKSYLRCSPKRRFREEHEQIDGCCKRNEEGTVGSTFRAMRSAECGCSPQHRTGIFHGDSSAALEYFGTAGGAGSTGTNQRMGGAVPQCGLLLL